MTTVVLSASIKRASVSDEYEAKIIPADLKKAWKAFSAGTLDEAAFFVIAKKYLVANFLAENLPDGDSLFEDAEEVWAERVEPYGLSGTGVLPNVTATASFSLKAGPELPKTDDAMAEWEDENTPLTDGVNFFWRFGETELVLGEHEGAGAEVIWPAKKKPKR